MDVDVQGEDVTPNKDGGVMKHVKRAGIGDLHPSTGDTVNVHYVGTLADNGKQFDSSRDRKEPFNFVLGRGQVIKGWDLGVAMMKKGELAVLTCRADYAYGEKGSGEKIPPGAMLNFEVELLSWSGEDISPDRDDSITRSIHVEGEKYSTPSECAPVKVYAVGKANGRTFYDRQVDFVLGEGSEQGLPDGVEKALRRMTKGETAHIHIKGSQFTYGNNPPKEFDLPPYAELDWILTLKDHEKAEVMPRYIEIADGNGKAYTFGIEDDGGIALESLNAIFPNATTVLLIEGNKKVSMRMKNGSIYPCDEWRSDVKYVAHFPESYPGNNIGSKRKRANDGLPMDDEEEDLIITRCRGYMLYFLLERKSPGEFIEGSIRQCATVVSKDIALTAGHCIPEGISNNYPINLYDESGKIYVVNALRVCKPEDRNDDYAILKIIEGSFSKIPNGLALPSDGERYFVLGYDAEYPHVSHLSCFSGRFRNTKIYANQSFVIGSPGTTDGCSGGGVFDQFGHLLGICVSGKLDWTNMNTTLTGHLNSLTLKLGQPSYSHIVPAFYCMGIAKEILK